MPYPYSSLQRPRRSRLQQRRYRGRIVALCVFDGAIIALAWAKIDHSAWSAQAVGAIVPMALFLILMAILTLVDTARGY